MNTGATSLWQIALLGIKTSVANLESSMSGSHHSGEVFKNRGDRGFAIFLMHRRGHTGLRMKSFFPLVASLAFSLSLPGPIVAAEQNAGHFSIQFPKDTNFDGMTVDAQTAGEWHKESDPPSYVIATTGSNAVKAIIFSPHYKTVLVDMPASFWKGRERTMAVKVEPIGQVPFNGHIFFPEGVDASRFVLEVRYVAPWGTEFFNLNQVDAPPRGFLAASVNLAPDGFFRASIPDFAHDTPMKWSKANDYLWLMVKEKKDGNSHFDLVNIPGKEKRPPAIAEEFHIKEKYNLFVLRAVAKKPVEKQKAPQN